jgi:hypothetical protein
MEMLLTSCDKLRMNFVTSTGLSVTRVPRIGKPSTALAFLPTSCIYLGCRAGRSRRQGTVCVFVCVNDALSLNCGAISLVDVCGGAILNVKYRDYFDAETVFSRGLHLT